MYVHMCVCMYMYVYIHTHIVLFFRHSVKFSRVNHYQLKTKIMDQSNESRGGISIFTFRNNLFLFLY